MCTRDQEVYTSVNNRDGEKNILFNILMMNHFFKLLWNLILTCMISYVSYCLISLWSSWLKFFSYLGTPKYMLRHMLLTKSLQSCPTLCDPIDGSPPGSAIPGILQARTLEWVAISFSNAWKWKVKVKSLSRVWLFATPWTAAYQAPPSMGFARQEYWSGVPLPSLIFN